MRPKAFSCLTLWTSKLRLQGDPRGCVRGGNVGSLGLKCSSSSGVGCEWEGEKGAGHVVALFKHLLSEWYFYRS